MTYISLDVEILEVKSVLPDVDANDGDMGEERILVSRSYNLQTLGGGIVALGEGRQQLKRSDGMKTHEPAPTRTLNSGSSGVKLGFKVVDAAKGTLELSLQRPIPEDATAASMFLIGGEVLPEEGVVDVT